MKPHIANLVEISRLQSALDSLYISSGIPSAIIDNEGTIHTASGWQDLCTKFHRVHPEARKLCIESDQYISRHIHEAAPSITYKCPHGLVDSATPIIIEGEHIGNVFTGQLFLEEPDLDSFRAQARAYGFNEEKYIDAVRKVPVISEQAMQENLAFVAQLTGLLAETGLKRTREKEIEVRLRESLEDYRTLFSRASDGIFFMSRDGTLIEVNESFSRMHGYSTGEMMRMNIKDLETPETSKMTPERMRRVLAGEVLTFEVEHYHKDGHVFPVEVSASLTSYGGESCIQGFHRDISERKWTEEALRASEERLVEAHQIARLGYYNLDVATGTWTSSVILDDIFGIGDDFRRDVEGWSRLIHPEDRQAMLDYLRNDVLGNKKPFDCEYRIVRPSDSSVRWVHGMGKVERDPLDRPVNMFGTIQDITERKRAEEERDRLQAQLQQTQKLESLGVLAGGIAHDFNNILMIVLGHAELALDGISPMSAARGNLTEITTAARRAADLCRQMLAYAGKATFALERVALRDLVEEMAHLLKAVISKKVILNLNLERGLPPIEADPSQIRQIVMNLIINASEATCDRSGVITVSVGATRCDEEYLREDGACTPTFPRGCTCTWR